MLMELTMGTAAIVSLVAVSLWRRRQARAIDAGIVSTSWLSEYKLGRRDWD